VVRPPRGAAARLPREAVRRRQAAATLLQEAAAVPQGLSRVAGPAPRLQEDRDMDRGNLWAGTEDRAGTADTARTPDTEETADMED